MAKQDDADLKAASKALDAVLHSLGLSEAYADGSISDSDRRKVVQALIDGQCDDFRAKAETLNAAIEAAAKPVASFALSDMIAAWRDGMAKSLRRGFLAASLALFGPDLEPADLSTIDAAHAVQVAYLDRFAAELISGVQPPNGSVPNRAALYAESAWSAAFNALTAGRVRAGYTHAKRRLGEASKHCTVCPAEAAKGWQPIDEILPIGASPCQNSCRCSISYATNSTGTFSMPDAASIARVATFDLGSSYPDGEYVLYENSRLFTCGDYPDKSFSLTPAEARAAVEAFTESIPVGLEHVPNVLDKKLGHVRSIRMGDDGQSVFGTVAIPKWLDSVLAPEDRKVSAEWDRAKKTLRKLDLVTRPRVTGAALMSAFSAAHPDDPEAGTEFTVDADDDADATFAEKKRTPEATGHMQKTHDLMALWPGACPVGVPIDGAMPGAYFADKPAQIKAFKSMHDTAVSHGATCAGMAGKFSAKADDPAVTSPTPKAGLSSAAPTPKGKPAMKWYEKFAASLGLKPEQVEQGFNATFGDPSPEAAAVNAPTIAGVTAPANFAQAASIDALNAQIAQMKADAKKDRESNRDRTIASEAASFANTMIAVERRALPSDRADIVGEFTQAALDDDVAPTTVTFADGDSKVVQGTRLDALKARYRRRPQHDLTDSRVAGGASREAFFALTGADHSPDKEGEEIYAAATKYAERRNGRGSN